MDLKAVMGKSQGNNENYLIEKRFDIQDGKYGIWDVKDKSFTFIPKGSAVYVSRVVNQIDTGEKYLELYFFDAKGHKIQLTFPRKELTELGIMRLLAFGVQVVKQDSRALITTIFNQEPDAESVLQHKTLGFSIYDEKTIFLGKKSIGVESNYNGRLQIGEVGSYNNVIRRIIWSRFRRFILRHFQVKIV